MIGSIYQPGASSNLSLNKELLGPKNGSNNLFFTPDKFVANTIAVYYNGDRLKHGADFTVQESGGAGSGYDLVVFTYILPLLNDTLICDYIKDN